MSLSKAGTLQYEDMPLRKDKAIGKKLLLKELENMDTGAIVWHLIKRHKFALVTLAFIGQNAWLVYQFIAYGVK